MFTLKGRQDGFRLLLPKEFLTEDITKKYSKILEEKHSYIVSPIDFLNETIQSVQVLGFNDAAVIQQQHGRGNFTRAGRPDENYFLHTGADVAYRSDVNPLQLIDKTINITFRHTLGFVNYFMMFENFFQLYERDTTNENMIHALFVDILNEHGEIYSRIEISNPIINNMDMLDLNYTQPIAQSQTFNVQFKYSNINFEFITNDNPHESDTLSIITVR